MSMDYYARPEAADLTPASISAQPPGLLLVLGCAAHLPLAILMRYVPMVAALHAWGVLALGLWLLVRDKVPVRMIYLGGYIAGSEVLWRMARTDIFWEYGKYSIGFLLILAMVKWPARARLLPLVYFLLLVPSVIFTFSDYPFTMARSQVSFNLSGPFLLAIAGLFFSGRVLHREQIRRMSFYIIMPICGIAFLAFFKIHTAGHIDFITDSNVAASGGYGPNQVSALLGLGALLCWLYLLDEEKFSKISWVVAGLLLWLLGQAFLTFSRGGIYNFVIAGVAAIPYLGLKRRKMMSFIMLCLTLLTIFSYIFTKLDAFTGNVLEKRFKETTTTGRGELMKQDIQLWLDNFLFGVGPGRSPELRGGGGTYFGSLSMRGGGGMAAHTEYTRLLAEHGLFGLLAILLLFIMFFRAVLKAPSAYARGLTLAFMLWGLCEMSHQAMRLAAISYLFAIPMARIEEN